jgi:methionine-rich copper-binding protein CopC
MTRRWLIGAAVLVALVASLISPSGTVAAVAELDFTLPADGTTVGRPIAEISVGFTEPVTLVGNGFEVLTPAGTVLEPFPVTDDDMVFRLPLDPPLAGGAVGVRYVVTDASGRTLEGSFVFDVAAPLPTTVAAGPGPQSTAPATSVVVSTVATAASAAPTSTSEVAATSTDVVVAGDDGSNRNTVIIAAVAVAVVAAGFLAVRSRRHGG